MQKSLIAVFAIAVVAISLGVIFQDPIEHEIQDMATRDMFVHVDQADYDTGPALGTQLPELEFNFAGRQLNVYDKFTKGSGLVLLALPSLDECMYSVKQIVQLQEIKHLFQIAGIRLVAITYDPHEVQQAFVDEHDLTIPLLPDERSESFRTLDILNDDYEPGDSEFGSPHPGFIVVNRQGEIVGKLFVEDPDLRVDSREVLSYAKQTLGLKNPFQKG